MSNKVKMTVDEFSKVMANVRDLYEACVRNNYYLPKIKSTMVTEEYMKNVINGKAFCPKFDDIKMLPCPRPPNKEVLIDKFLEICVSHNFTMNCGIDDKHKPDKTWLINFIASFKPDDEIFKKNYVPPAKENKLSELKTIEMPADFMDGLPQSKRRVRRKGLRIAKDGLRAQKKERFKMMSKKFHNSMLLEEAKDDKLEEAKRSKVKSVRATTNESSFKAPGNSTPVKSGTGSKSNSLLNSSMMQPQAAIQQSPVSSVTQWMQGISFGTNSK